MPRIRLMQAFVNGTSITLYNHATRRYVTGTIQSIEREDGSGFCYNVAIGDPLQTLFVRTR